jgi:hypothetical protein
LAIFLACVELMVAVSLWDFISDKEGRAGF